MTNSEQGTISNAAPSSSQKQRYFIGMALSIYIILNGYIGIRGWHWVHSGVISPTFFLVIFLSLVFSYPMGRWIHHRWPNLLSAGIFFLGSWYLGAMVYLLFGILVQDILNIFLAITPLPQLSVTVNRWLFYALLIITLWVTFYGFWNAQRYFIRELSISLPLPPSGKAQTLCVVVVSDLHLGTVIRPGKLTEIVATINQFKPELILIAGDILDENLPKAWWSRFLEPLRQLQAPLGVLAVSGNHEHFIGIDAARQAITHVGIRLLEDEVVVLKDTLAIIGRQDASAAYFQKTRLPLSSLLKATPPQLPVIVLDHQPRQLQEAQQAGVHLQISGHTHDGQFWPFTWVTRKVWPLSYGYRQIGNTHFYVTSGIGVWGPPLRLGSRAELVVLQLHLVPQS